METIECWRQLFVEPKNLGFTLMLLLVTGDFRGLNNLVDSFWPYTDKHLYSPALEFSWRRIRVESRGKKGGVRMS